MTFTLRARGWIGMALVLGAFTCDDGEDFCDHRCDCEGCTERAYDDCVYWYHQNGDFEACAGDWDAYVACVNDTGTCVQGDFDHACGPEKDRWESCSSS